MARLKIILLVCIVLGLALSGCAKKPAAKPDLSKPPKYVGSKACQECHNKIYKTFQGTLHPRMIQDAKKNPNAIMGDFEIESVIRTFSKRQVVYTIGNQWAQLYITKIGKDYYFLPAEWSVTEGIWKPYKMDKWKLPEESWTKKCVGCHVTGYNPRTKKWVEEGIGCEACHGPGNNHVKAEKWGKANPGERLEPISPVPLIVNPAKLPSGLATMVCGSCHSRGKGRFTPYPYPVGFRPGMSLDLIYELLPSDPQKAVDEAQAEEVRKRFWPNGFAKSHELQYQDFLKSAHFQQGLTCFSCHTVHSPGKGNRYQTKLPGSVLCLSCHKTPAVPRLSHSIHNFGGCVGCHMPLIVAEAGILQMHSHTFKAISPEETIKAGGNDKQPNSCNICHYHKDDPPEEMLEVLNRIKEKVKTREGLSRPSWED